MLRITDMTLSCIDTSHIETNRLRQLYDLLAASGADLIEMPSSVYERLRPLPTKQLVLRLFMPDESTYYPEVIRFVCRKNGIVSAPTISILREIQMNDIKEMAFLGSGEPLENIRVVGLDDILCHDYEAIFSKLRNRISGRIEFCPENSVNCATAAAVEWIASGGTDIAVSFGGVGGKAALEEVLLALRVTRRHKPTASFASLPQISELIEDINGIVFPDRKAVIGRKIFNVESGIHVDGILKKPQMYEPFYPELVGGHRRFIIGKHSGRKSISAKLCELGLDSSQYDIGRLLGAVREKSVHQTSSLTDDEFLDVASQHKL